MSDEQRHSVAADATLITDPDEIARRESENAVAQFDRVLDMVDEIARGSRPFRFRPSMVIDLHRIALEGLSAYAGNFRPSDVAIGQSKHTPPSAHLVASLIEDMCDYVTENADDSEALHLCAYVMWRLNWIHPFTDGNGRTSRALAYYVLCGKLGYLLPGRETVPEQIAADRTPYYAALEDADRHEAEGGLTSLRWKHFLIAAWPLNCYRHTTTLEIRLPGARESESCIKLGNRFRRCRWITGAMIERAQ